MEQTDLYTFSTSLHLMCVWKKGTGKVGEGWGLHDELTLSVIDTMMANPVAARGKPEITAFSFRGAGG